MSGVPIELDSGRAAELCALDGDRVRLRAEQAAAPGSRLAGRLSSGHEVRLKIFRCIRQGERFELSGRLVDATRELRAVLGRDLAHRAAQEDPE